MLPWEIAAERQSRPVLDLSGGSIGEDELSLSDAASVGSAGGDKTGPDAKTNVLGKDPCNDWTNGQIWLETKAALVELSVLTGDEPRSEEFLSTCPQLARLPTEDILASAQEVIGSLDLSTSAIQQNPMLLSYPSARPTQNSSLVGSTGTSRSNRRRMPLVVRVMRCTGSAERWPTTSARPCGVMAGPGRRDCSWHHVL